jgi:hypothetical protein
MSLVNIYTAQDGEWSTIAIVTVCIIGTWGIATGSSLAICEMWLLRKMRSNMALIEGMVAVYMPFI